MSNTNGKENDDYCVHCDTFKTATDIMLYKDIIPQDTAPHYDAIERYLHEVEREIFRRETCRQAMIAFPEMVFLVINSKICNSSRPLPRIHGYKRVSVLEGIVQPGVGWCTHTRSRSRIIRTTLAFQRLKHLSPDLLVSPKYTCKHSPILRTLSGTASDPIVAV